MNTPTPTAIKKPLVLEITDAMPAHMLQGKRLFEYLSNHPKAPSGHVAQSCSIGNISDVAHAVNPYLRKHNLMVGCEKPLTPIINKFKEKSNQFNWSVYQVPQPANDSTYSQDQVG